MSAEPIPLPPPIPSQPQPADRVVLSDAKIERLSALLWPTATRPGTRRSTHPDERNPR